jgi:two-component system phosphate regulon sensor histidine kinase PhoR
MFSEMLLSGRTPQAKQQQYLEIIVSESERLSALIDNVLDFARLERRNEAYEFRQVDIREPVARAVDVCRPRADRQSVPLELELAVAGEATTELDERSLEIAIINLIDNALKYAPKSEKVHIRLSREGEKYRIAVTDGGAGIPRDQWKKIFERFVRGTTTADGTRGSGIGLSLVAQIAEAHRGKAWVEEAPGGGACFVMTIGR